MRTRGDALRSMKRYLALAFGDAWEVRLWDEEGTFNRPFIRVMFAGGSLYSGPAPYTDIVQPIAIHAYPDEAAISTVEEAILQAEQVEELLYRAFRVGIAYDDPLMPPPTFLCVGYDTGGTLPAGSYDYQVSAVNASGESLPQEAVSADIAAPGSVELVWTPAPGATSYKLYRDGLLLTTTTSVTFIDDGSTVPAGAPPATGTGHATIHSAPLRVPLYNYDGVPYSGLDGFSNVREVSDYVRILDLSINTLHDPTDDRLVWVVADIRTSWRAYGRVPSGTKVLKSVTNTLTTS